MPFATDLSDGKMSIERLEAIILRSERYEREAYIRPPDKIPFYMKLGLMVSKKVTKKDLLVPKLLAWYPKVAISSGVMESLVAHERKIFLLASSSW